MSVGIGALVDTMVAQRFDRDEARDYVRESAGTASGLSVSVVSIFEGAYGVTKARGRAAADEAVKPITDLVDDGHLTLVDIDSEIAHVAGLLRAEAPRPAARRGDRRRKPQLEVSWAMDCFVAASAWISGLDVVTDNRGDFERLSDTITALFGNDGIDVIGPPTPLRRRP